MNADAAEASRRLRVLLVHPGIDETGHRRQFPPWGILYVAQALERAGHVARVADLNGESAIETEIERLAERFRPHVVGVTGKWGHAARRAQRLLEVVAAQFPETRRVLGGPLASILPAGTRLEELVHAVLSGDGETALVRWIEHGMPGGRSPIPAQDADLAAATLDVPHLLDLGPYVQPADRSDLGVRSLYVSGARGCTGKCAFCYVWSHAPAGLRLPPAEPLVDGLLALCRRYHLGGFYFVDDDVMTLRPWRRRFCKLLQDSGEGIVWGVDLRAAVASPETLEDLWEGGCRALYMGLETADDEILADVVKKGHGAGTMLDVVDRALEMGFALRASVVLGWPGETALSFERTLEAVESRPGLLVDAFLYNPLPGTPLGERHALDLGPQHMFTDYGPGAPNLSDASDEALQRAWESLQTIRDERGWAGPVSPPTPPRYSEISHGGEDRVVA